MSRHHMNPACALPPVPAHAGEGAAPAVEGTPPHHRAPARLWRAIRRVPRADVRACADALVLVVLFPAALGAMYASIAFTPAAYR